MATINGTTGNDTLTGTTGDDTINGFEGNDLFLAGSTGGNDVINGGAGRDSIEFKTRATSAIVVDFVAGSITGGSSGTISFTSIERVLTGDFNDTLIGNAAGQTLTGQGGSDTISSAGGVDTLWGGTGADSFVFRETGTANADRISDFASGSDKIVLDASVMTALGASGNFASGDARFTANSTGTAQDTSDRIIYETDTRQIWYDPDGNGAAARQLIATLQTGATLVATDIVVQGGSGGGSGTIVGTEGDDSLTGTSGNDTIDGRGGNDTIDGHAGDDRVIGGTGSDLLMGGAGRDELVGGDGNDTMHGWVNNGQSTVSSRLPPDETDAPDTMSGGLGDDHYYADNAADVFSDAGGIDTVHVDEIDWTLADGLENLELSGDLRVTGVGNGLANFMRAPFGGGRLEGRAGDDTLTGTERSLELFGEDGNDSLVGNWLGDLLDGGAGNDTLAGSFDWDTLAGGGGADVFIYDERLIGDDELINTYDTILDFASGLDSIVLDARVMPQLGTSGTLAPNDPRFYAAPGATGGHDADDRLVYDTDSGDLYYDEDGSGSLAAEVILRLNSGAEAAALDETDITIINGTPSGSAINGSSGNDTLDGTQGDDTIDGLGGNDLVTGNQGADSLRGGSGNDTLIGGEAWTIPGRPDFIGSGRDFAIDTLDGGLGDDVYHVSGPDHDGDVIIADAGGIDTVFSWNGDWTLGAGLENLDLADDAGISSNGTGNELDNIIQGSSEGGTLSGMGGNDLLVIRIAENTGRAFGGDGNDTLLGNGADGGGDQLSGDAGDDLLATGGGNSTVTGGAGADVFYFNVPLDPFENADPPQQRDLITDFVSTIDTIRLDGAAMSALGGSGRFSATDARFAANSTGTAQDSSDRVVYNTSSGDLWYDADGTGATERLLIGTLQGAPGLAPTDIEVVNGTAPGNVINGTSSADTLTGTDGDDTINGFDGNDLFLAGSTGGNDVINGGAGRDSIEFKERATSAITVDFVSGTITGGSSGTISFTNIERILTGNFNDTLTGNGASQTLTGQGGSDTIGGAGGADTLWGGTGADAFVFREMGTANADRISDFASGSDKVHLDDAAFTAIGAMGNFAAADGRFKANSSGTATDTSDRVVFNTSTGQLYYDADGSGSGAAAQIIATVQSGATVAATDIVVV